MILDLHPCKACAQEGGRNDRADKSSAVAAYCHGDTDMNRICAEFVSHSCQYREKAIKIRIRAKQQSQRHGQDADDKGQKPSHGLGDNGASTFAMWFMIWLSFRTPKNTPAARIVEAIIMAGPE